MAYKLGNPYKYKFCQEQWQSHQGQHPPSQVRRATCIPEDLSLPTSPGPASSFWGSAGVGYMGSPTRPLCFSILVPSLMQFPVQGLSPDTPKDEQLLNGGQFLLCHLPCRKNRERLLPLASCVLQRPDSVHLSSWATSICPCLLIAGERQDVQEDNFLRRRSAEAAVTSTQVLKVQTWSHGHLASREVVDGWPD